MIPTYCFVWCGARSKIVLNRSSKYPYKLCIAMPIVLHMLFFFFPFFLSVHSYNHFNIVRRGLYIIYKDLGDVLWGTDVTKHQWSRWNKDLKEVSAAIFYYRFTLLFIFYLPSAFQLYSVLELFDEFSLLTPAFKVMD